MSEQIKNTFEKTINFFFNIYSMLILGVILGFICFRYELWDFFEPILGIASVTILAATWWQTRKAREAVYADNGNGSWVVALQVGRPISEAVKKQFGQLDALVDVEDVIGCHTLSLPEHYEMISRAVYTALVHGQGKNIHLILSGPVALSFLVGQMAGLFHFQLTVYQYDPSTGGYKAMPKPTRAWLKHRQ